MAIHSCCLVKLQQICLRTWYHSIRHTPRSNLQFETLLCKTDAWSSATLESCNAVATAIYMPACQVYVLPQTPLLFKYAYWLSAAARWMLAGSLLLNTACQLVLCFSICNTCWYGVCLSGVPAGVMPNYRPYLPMRCLKN